MANHKKKMRSARQMRMNRAPENYSKNSRKRWRRMCHANMRMKRAMEQRKTNLLAFLRIQSVDQNTKIFFLIAWSGVPIFEERILKNCRTHRKTFVAQKQNTLKDAM